MGMCDEQLSSEQHSRFLPPNPPIQPYVLRRICVLFLNMDNSAVCGGRSGIKVRNFSKGGEILNAKMYQIAPEAIFSDIFS